MTSSVSGADGGNMQSPKTTGGKLSGSPKLTFAKDAAGDTITRKAGTWDGNDGFAIGQIITITGALNAGMYTITIITNGGKTLVLDATNTVEETVTAALSIVGYVYTPPQASPAKSDDGPEASEKTTDALADISSINVADSPESGERVAEELPDISSINIDSSSGDGKQTKRAPLELLPIESDDSPGDDKRTKDLPPKASPVKKKDSPKTDKRIAKAPPELLPIESDDSPGDGKQTKELPPKASPVKQKDSPKTDKRIAKAPPAILPVSDESSTDASRRATDAPGRAIRSGIEIAKMLEAICEEELAVTAYPDKGELLFVSRMRAVDPDLGRIIIEYSQWKPANSALLVCEQVLFHVERKNRHIQFLTTLPKEVVFGGSAGIQVVFPQFVLDLQQRAHRRFSVKSLPSLWCVIKREGFDPIVANVTDISRGGLGGIVHDPGIVLKPGTIIKECQITGTSLKRPVDVSVEVRHWKTIRAQDGTLSKRVGCRFVASSLNLQQLIDVFEIQLDEAGPED
jgi:c-di-GMP-binding flagellar brake protein YcgR